jgi:hypothetical protein
VMRFKWLRPSAPGDWKSPWRRPFPVSLPAAAYWRRPAKSMRPPVSFVSGGSEDLLHHCWCGPHTSSSARSHTEKIAILTQLSSCSPFARLISHQPAVLFSQNEPATSNQPQPASSTLLSEQTSASHQPPANRTGWWFRYFDNPNVGFVIVGHQTWVPCYFDTMRTFNTSSPCICAA